MCIAIILLNGEFGECSLGRSRINGDGSMPWAAVARCFARRCCGPLQYRSPLHPSAGGGDPFCSGAGLPSKHLPKYQHKEHFAIISWCYLMESIAWWCAALSAPPTNAPAFNINLGILCIFQVSVHLRVSLFSSAASGLLVGMD